MRNEIGSEIANSKNEHEGCTVYFCSKHCEEEFKKNPKKYMSKVKK